MEKKGEFEKRIRAMSTIPNIDDFLDLVEEAKKEFYQIEEIATKKANQDLKSGLSGGQNFVTLFIRHSINITASFREKWFRKEMRR